MVFQEVIKGILSVSKLAPKLLLVSALDGALVAVEYKMAGGIICHVAVAFAGISICKASSLLITKQCK